MLDRLIALEGQCTLVPILGNHDQMFLQILLDARATRRESSDWLRVGGRPMKLSNWLEMGGDATLAIVRRPRAHRSEPDADRSSATRSRPNTSRSSDAVATTTRPRRTSSSTPSTTRPADGRPAVAIWLRWESLRDGIPDPHVSGKTAIVGHTSQKDGEILDLGHLVCIDTFCYGGGWLTALDVHTGEVWQANREGDLRPPRTG